jgi:hypothetical protein
MKICIICGQPEDQHHEPEWAEMPPGCVCNPMDYRDPRNIPPVCDKYEGNGVHSCLKCEHDKECHK